MNRTEIPLRPSRTADPGMATVAHSIARVGTHVVHVGEGCDCGGCSAAPLPPDQRFGYTVGLTERGHPDLMVRGLGPRETAGLLNRWAGAVLDGQILDAGHLLCEGPAGTTWELVPVRRATRVLAWASRYYRPSGRSVAALELIPARRPCPCDGCG